MKNILLIMCLQFCVFSLGIADEDLLLIPAPLTDIESFLGKNSKTNKFAQAVIKINEKTSKEKEYGSSFVRPYYNKSKNVWIFELCKQIDSFHPGIYYISSNGLFRYDWFDPKLNMLVCIEEDSNSVYKLTIDSGSLVGFKYEFQVNLSSGFYKVKVKDKKLVVEKKETYDDPS